MFKHISCDTDYKQGSWEFLDGNNSACLSRCFKRISVANNIGPFAEFLSKFSGQSDLVGTIFEPLFRRFEKIKLEIINYIKLAKIFNFSLN